MFMVIYFLVGPTASGKTKLSIELAKKLNAEIISCDSMCVYKGMDILTSKPSLKEREAIKHHLIDIISPTKEFSAAKYRELALKVVEDILRRGKTPLFVGGSALYVKAIIDGIFESTKKDERFRNAQMDLAEKYGNKYLYNKLVRIDKITADKIHPNDLRRVIRALEIYHTEKLKPSELKKKTIPLKYGIICYGIEVPRDRLYDFINKRVEEMFEKGIVEEVEKLSKIKLSLTAKNALGYREVLGYIKGEKLIEDAKELLKKNTRNFAKRQMTWFRADKRIEWKKQF